jgi:hypothetical protein
MEHTRSDTRGLGGNGLLARSGIAAAGSGALLSGGGFEKEVQQ